MDSPLHERAISERKRVAVERNVTSLGVCQRTGITGDDQFNGSSSSRTLVRSQIEEAVVQFNSGCLVVGSEVRFGFVELSCKVGCNDDLAFFKDFAMSPRLVGYALQH
jgi:hypothetical protein